MEMVSFVVALALIEYFAFGILVGQARGKYGVPAPATTGHPVFDRTMRVQQNTLEQLVIFVPAMFLFAQYVSPGLACLLGLVFIAGRALYYRGYVEDPSKRSLGFALSAIPQVLLLLGAALGALYAAL